MHVDVEFATFAPKDLTAITGLSPAMQRDWRRAGHLPSREAGWASFSLMDVCAIAVRKLIADAGLGPAFANTLLDGHNGHLLVASVRWWALEAQDVGDWLVGTEQAVADELMAADARDHFAVIQAITGLDPAQRLRAVTIDPIAGVVDTENFDAAADQEAIEFIVRLDVVGRRVSARAGRSLVKGVRAVDRDEAQI